jgi:hypothetical protein
MRSFTLLVAAAALFVACKEKEPAGLVADAAPLATTPVDAGPPAVDIMQCAGCAQAAQPAWQFAGIYRDEQCTDPVAQTAPSACAVIAAPGPAPVTFIDEAPGHKAGETANVTLSEQLAPEAPRFRKAGTKCVRANEMAVNLTPMGCAGQRVCRDVTGGLTCTGSCRTLSTGCPDFEETRMYAVIGGNKARPAASGGSNSLARLRECCNQLSAEARRLGASPEAGVLASAAAQCVATVNAAGPNGTAPELGLIRNLLAGRNLPAVCAGF